MLIAHLPPVERPRERLSAHGVAALADRELLALVLGTGGTRGLGAHHLAERLLNRFGSMAALARAHPAELVGLLGVGPAKAAAIAAAFELGRRSARPPTATVITSTADLVGVVAPLLRGRARERLALVVCDNANRVTSCEVVSEGSAERALVPVRELVAAVLRRDGTAFALAHNHPSGDLTPSPADLDATHRVERAARTLGLRFLDHVVVSDTGWRRVDPQPSLSAAQPADGRSSPPAAGGRAASPPADGRAPSQPVPAHGL
jgi:DNA repair protein RadC